MQQDVKWDIDIVVLHDWAEGAPARIRHTETLPGVAVPNITDALYVTVWMEMAYLKRKVLWIEAVSDNGTSVTYKPPVRLYNTFGGFQQQLKKSKRHCTLSVYLKGDIEIRATAHKQTKRRRDGQE